MDRGTQLLSELVFYRTYPRTRDDGLKETRAETILRCASMHTDRFPVHADSIHAAFAWVHSGHVRPSMRSFQFAGEPILRDNIRIYNCAGQGADSWKKFADFCYILMCGTGQGVSVESRYVSCLPAVAAPREGVTVIIPDAKEGWADSFLALLENPGVEFDYSRIRAQGTPLSTGGTASGPDALARSHAWVRGILRGAIGRKLTDLECADIICMIAECVVVGGVRRSALICLFDAESDAMLRFKAGDWWRSHPWRARANVSARLLRTDARFEEKLRHIVSMCMDNGTGEPGVSLANDTGWFYNPCHEIALKAFCNLSSVNVAACRNRREMVEAVRAATFIGALQKTYTDFNYIGPAWKADCEEEALLGVSFTGLAMAWERVADAAHLHECARVALDTDAEAARRLGVRPAHRIGTVKPSGTESAELGVTAGIHPAYGRHALRRVRVARSSLIGKALEAASPAAPPGAGAFLEVDATQPETLIVALPLRCDGAIVRGEENSVALLERARHLSDHWIRTTHRQGPNPHNVSLTVSYRPEEKESIIAWMIRNKDSFSGVSLLPYVVESYAQPPLEEITEEQYQAWTRLLPDDLDFAGLRAQAREQEPDDRFQYAACGATHCEP